MDLSSCREGDSVVIRRLSASGAIRKRLLEMGFINGARIKIVKYAPLRDPMEVSIKNARVSIRVKEAEQIYVTKTAAET
ncbi:MAG: hypothetical protein GF398_00450 [Chitinivibrionales bacterium]|nr:hypothetical protein [Chitinivibrionales bacterium]